MPYIDLKTDLNPFGVVHAGAILWFADVTATVLAMSSTQASEGMAGFPLAINLNANFVSNQKAGKLRAVASFVKKGKTVSIVRTTVFGEKDKLIADVSTNHVAARWGPGLIALKVRRGEPLAWLLIEGRALPVRGAASLSGRMRQKAAEV